MFDFVARCDSAPLDACFDEIRTQLDQLRATENRHGFCIPPVWGGFVPSRITPVSVLDYLKLRLSAARIGRAGEPTEAVLRDVLADMFPCREATR